MLDSILSLKIFGKIEEKSTFPNFVILLLGRLSFHKCRKMTHLISIWQLSMLTRELALLPTIELPTRGAKLLRKPSCPSLMSSVLITITGKELFESLHAYSVLISFLSLLGNILRMTLPKASSVKNYTSCEEVFI